MKKAVLLIVAAITLTSCYKGRYEDAIEENRVLTENYLALSAEVDLLRAEVLRLENENELLRDVIADLEAQVLDSETKAYLEELKMEVERQAEVILELEQQIADQLDINDQVIDALEEALNNALTEWGALEAEVLTLRDQVEALNAENATLESTIAALQQSIDAYVAQIATLNQTIATMELDLEDRDNTIADLNQAIDRMQGQIDRLVRLIENLLNRG